MKRIVNFLLLTTTTVLLVSCGSMDYKKTKSGLRYKLFASNEKDSLAGNADWLKLHFVQKINDSVIQSSYGKMPAYAKYNVGSNVDYTPLEVFPFLKKGDSVVVVLSLDSMLKKGLMQQLPPNTKKSDRIVYNFKIIDVFRNDSTYEKDEAHEKELDKPRLEKEREEQMAQMRLEMLEKRKQEEVELEKSGEAAKGIQAMESYLASKNITGARKMGKGTFVVVNNAGDGEQVADGKYVEVNYVGSLIRNDSIFDKGRLERRLGQGELIMGMEEGLEAFKKGGKGTLYIPGFRAYGKSHPRFQPFEPMKFEIEVLNVSDTLSKREEVPVPKN